MNILPDSDSTPVINRIYTIVEEVPGCKPPWFICNGGFKHPYPNFESLEDAKTFCRENGHKYIVEYYEP